MVWKNRNSFTDGKECSFHTNERTLDSYLNALRRIFIIEDVPAWSPSLRSKTTTRTSHKRQLVDPSIATAVMRIDGNRLLQDLETFGFMFESLCIPLSNPILM